jgi:hypothetical protein
MSDSRLEELSVIKPSWPEKRKGYGDDVLERDLSPDERLEAVVEILARGGLAVMADKNGENRGAEIVDFPGNKRGHEPRRKS